MEATTFFDRLLAILLPEACALCGQQCTRGFCATCRSQLPRVPSPCEACGLPCPTAVPHECPPLPGIRAVFAPFAFREPVIGCLHSLKYSRRRSLARALALAAIDSAEAALPGVDAWVPVPLHPARLRERSFNQAEEIARVLARATRRPLLTDVLCRRRRTESQTTLPAAGRRKNLAGAFAATRAITGLRIALVDDVVTTGATVVAAAEALACAGAQSICAVAIARTPAGPAR